MISKKEFLNKYEKANRESQKWDMTYQQLSKSNDVMAFVKHMQTAKEFYFDDAYICGIIKKFTYADTPEEKKISLIHTYLTNNTIASVSQEGLTTIFVKPDNTRIEFRTLTEQMPNLRAKEELESQGRMERCHQGCLNLSEFEFNFPHDVVTGYTHGISDKSEYLHTWIETVDDGKEVVIDYTMNAIINKDAYYKFMHIIPLARISGENVKTDMPLIFKSKKFRNIDNRMYLLFRDEIMAEIENKPSGMGE